MKRIISLAKKMNVDNDTLPAGELPLFLYDAEWIKSPCRH